MNSEPVISEEFKRTVRQKTLHQSAQLDEALSLIEDIDKTADELLRRTSPPPPNTGCGTHESEH